MALRRRVIPLKQAKKVYLPKLAVKIPYLRFHLCSKNFFFFYIFSLIYSKAYDILQSTFM